MKLRLLVLLTLLVQCAVVTTSPSAQAATTHNYITWGRSYAHKSYVFHQVPGSPGPLSLHSANGQNDFVVNADGDLSTSRLHPRYGYGQLLWYPYWRAHSNGKGAFFFMQSDGHLIVKRSDKRTIVWKTGKYLKSGSYNFALVLGNDGTLTEYYSSGNPLQASGRHTLWKMGRVVGVKHACGGGGLGAGTSSFNVLLQNGVYSVNVHNAGYLGMLASVYRWYAGKQLNRRAAEIAPGSTHDFGSHWYVDDDDFETVVVRVDTTADNPTAAATVSGYCWYVA